MKLRTVLLSLGFTFPAIALAGAQTYEPLAAEVRAGLQASIADRPSPRHAFKSSEAAVDWLTEMSQRLSPRISNFDSRVGFLRTVHFEATRARVDPQLVLALIQVESNFRKYAVSRSGARGYMQVMPFWVRLIGRQLLDGRISMHLSIVNCYWMDRSVSSKQWLGPRQFLAEAATSFVVCRTALKPPIIPFNGNER